MSAFRMTLLLLLVAPAWPALGQDFDFGAEEEKTFELHGESSNLLLWRNDRDFDPTIPYYEEEGQSVGAISSFFKTQLTYRPLDNIELFYESELGLNFYSRNDPDQWFPAADDFVAFKHREFYTRLKLDLLELRIGYQRIQDPTDLFLSHWFGAFRADLDLMRLRAGAFIGQLPDSTYEGLEIRDNNFVHDNVIGGLTLSYDILLEELIAEVGTYFLYDSRIPRKELLLSTSYAGLRYESDILRASLHGLVQAGRWQASGVAGIDQTILAWAASAKVTYLSPYVDVGITSTALSPDDNGHGNRRLGTFFASGKNHSASLLLTEDEIRDRYDNFDEQMAGRWGAFFTARAGLSVTDLSITGKVGDFFFPQLIVAAGFVLNPENAGGHSYAGFEADLVLRIRFLTRVDMVLVGQFFQPGKAAATFVNETDLTATEQIHGLQFGTVVTF
jgi:hypothetical protein